MCAYQAAIATPIQHRHLEQKTWIGSEFRLPEWRRKPVDGYYVGDDGSKNVVEFLGDTYHGHPSLWLDNEEARDRFGRRHKDRFYDTETKMRKLKALNYIVHYVWESDYQTLMGKLDPLSVLRTFDNDLEWK